MAQPRRTKTLPDGSMDLISQLPGEVKDRILECLSTRDAARMALLSTHWNDAWLQHGRLAFDSDFFHSVEWCYEDEEGLNPVNIINNILFFRAGPVKKFILRLSSDDLRPEESDFKRWCLFLSRNGVEELNLYLESNYVKEFKLPFCLLSCRTIKQLIVEGSFIDLPVNVVGIFSNVTSLAFFYVEFKRSVNGIASSISIPKLEKVAFELCRGINKFEIISPPKLEILSVIGSIYDVVDSRWLAPHLKAIKTLWLCGSSLLYMDVSMFPTAINLQVLKLYELRFGCGKQLTAAMQLLQKCPNLCELGIMVEKESNSWGDDKEVASRLLEDMDPDGCFVIPELKMLNTIKIESFRESALIIESFCESALIMLFMKMLLSKSPALERVVILKPWDMNDSEVSKILRKLKCFPRASPNAQIICTANYYTFEYYERQFLDLYPWF